MAVIVARRWTLAVPPLVAATLALAALVSRGSGDLTVPPGIIQWQAATARAVASVPQHGFSLGAKSAPVTVTEYADLRCSYCQVYAITTFPRLVNRFVRTGAVRLVFDAVAKLGPQSELAARAATAAASQNRLWSFLDAFVYRQQMDGSSQVSNRVLRDVASAAGLHVGQLMADLGSPSTRVVTRTQAVEAQAAHITRFPTFIITRLGSEGATRVVGYGPLLDALNRAVST